MRRMPCSPLRRLWSCCLETHCCAPKSIPLAFPMENIGLHFRVLMLQTAFTGCASLEEARHFSAGPEFEGTKAPSQTLWPLCCSLPKEFSWSLHFAQSASRARRKDIGCQAFSPAMPLPRWCARSEEMEMRRSTCSSSCLCER